MVVEAWILKIGNQVSSNLKTALYLDNNPTKSSNKKQTPKERHLVIGILSFEVANVMSSIMNLHRSLTDGEMSRLRNEILKCEAVRTLVAGDENHLLELALAEKLDDLNRIAGVVSRLGKKCSVPALQGFEHVYGDIGSGVIGVNELGFLVKDMEGMVRKMERYVVQTTSLHREMEVLSELESTAKKLRLSQHEESLKALEQKLIWQRQVVSHLKEVSLWNRTHDKVVELLARTVCTVYARIHAVFGDVSHSSEISRVSQQSSPKTGRLDAVGKVNGRRPSFVSNRTKMPLPRSEGNLFGPEDFNFACGIGPGRLFMECINLSTSSSKVSYDDDDVITVSSSLTRPIIRTGLGKPLVSAPAQTVGGSALALHYANLIIVIEKILRYPHLVGDEVRDDLYQMLPMSLRKTLKSKLKFYAKDLAIFDAHLAHDWKEKLDRTLGWLSPLAHNMIKWQSERNVEQHQIVARTNVLLLQTLYFADREKTEETICGVLVGLNYICRYEQQQNALLDCASSFDFVECMERHPRIGDSFGS